MVRIGIICPSEIAFRRFLPALQKCSNLDFVAIAIASPQEWFGNLCKVSQEEIEEQQTRELDKAKSFVSNYGGKIVVGYENLVSSDEIDAVYIPLPPALHYKWAKIALENNKHVLLEKPSTTSLSKTQELIDIASSRKLALHENYMFIYHNQLAEIAQIVDNGEIGDVRLYRITFGFPRRAHSDFRYNKALGGGALLDAGGYCMKYATYLLGDTVHLMTAQSNFVDGIDVDMYGSATLSNANGLTAQIAFGMDNDYRCDIEIWGSKGTITSCRILTAPVGYIPTYTLKNNQDIETRSLSSDDAFFKSLNRFYSCICNDKDRLDNYREIENQEKLVDEFVFLSAHTK